MAAAPWRCSECGTVNEPVANSCRTCGRWPSLFDLQESVYQENAPPPAAEVEVEAFEVETFEPETFEPQAYRSDTYRPDTPSPETFEVDELPAEAQMPESAAERRRRVITSLIVPLAFVIYIVISIILGDRGSG